MGLGYPARLLGTIRHEAGRHGMPSNEHGVIVEMIAIGRYVKVTAVDTRTGTEVSIVGDPRRGERALRDAAVRRLRFGLIPLASDTAPPMQCFTNSTACAHFHS